MQQYVIRICWHSMPGATMLYSLPGVGSSLLVRWWVIWLQNSILKVCFLGPLGTSCLKSGLFRNICWDREDRNIDAQILLGSNLEQCLWGSKGRIGQERLNCDTFVSEISVSPTESSGDGIDLQRCPKLSKARSLGWGIGSNLLSGRGKLWVKQPWVCSAVFILNIL